MMRVTIKSAGPLRDLAGVRGTIVDLGEGASTGDALMAVGQQFPSIHGELFGSDPPSYYSIFVNDRLIPEAQRECAPLADGDEMLLVLPVAGG
jgi:molybdopterin converting factor small subunit